MILGGFGVKFKKLMNLTLFSNFNIKSIGFKKNINWPFLHDGLPQDAMVALHDALGEGVVTIP
jgi:hypothetical protein